MRREEPFIQHSTAQPLDQAVGLADASGRAYGEETEFCDSGYCMI
jgi:hypothetical protein